MSKRTFEAEQTGDGDNGPSDWDLLKAERAAATAVCVAYANWLDEGDLEKGREKWEQFEQRHTEWCEAVGRPVRYHESTEAPS